MKKFGFAVRREIMRYHAGFVSASWRLRNVKWVEGNDGWLAGEM